jgi:hypothetical protein
VKVGENTISLEKTQLFRISLRVSYFLRPNARFAVMNHLSLIILWILAFPFQSKTKDCPVIHLIMQFNLRIASKLLSKKKIWKNVVISVKNVKVRITSRIR